ncbi:hypothetical protein B296_00032169 [Ensete ventricosum]|uniref:Protein kinase domain-containing protein n=1 Tax=Ensete ventricosum TaxID=4639 RepID=A0A426ZXJ0_ENSVE|nr:hypothetical protein B296_00032169 [Ensete ventricosum]
MAPAKLNHSEGGVDSRHLLESLPAFVSTPRVLPDSRVQVLRRNQPLREIPSTIFPRDKYRFLYFLQPRRQHAIATVKRNQLIDSTMIAYGEGLPSFHALSPTQTIPELPITPSSRLNPPRRRLLARNVLVGPPSHNGQLLPGILVSSLSPPSIDSFDPTVHVVKDGREYSQKETGIFYVYKYAKRPWNRVAGRGDTKIGMSEALVRDYEIGAEIGRGRFGVVRRCLSAVTGEEFALKSIEKRLLADDVDRECAEREVKIHYLSAAGNPHAVQIHAAFEDDKWVHLVLELLDGPDLCDRIAASKGTPFAEPEAAAVVAALAEAVAACHRRGVVHRDVKPDNVLFDARGRLKLADFGSAECFVGADGGRVPMRGIVGTPWYVAPEVVTGREYGEKVDVWSVGVVMYMMLAGGLPPFYGESAVEIFDAVARANLRFPPRVFRSVSPAAKDLMRRILCKDVSRRFSAEQVLS